MHSMARSRADRDILRIRYRIRLRSPMSCRSVMAPAVGDVLFLYPFRLQYWSAWRVRLHVPRGGEPSRLRTVQITANDRRQAFISRACPIPSAAEFSLRYILFAENGLERYSALTISPYWSYCSLLSPWSAVQILGTAKISLATRKATIRSAWFHWANRSDSFLYPDEVFFPTVILYLHVRPDRLCGRSGGFHGV